MGKQIKQQAAPGRKNLLVIEDNSVRAMMQDPRITELLPCLIHPRKRLLSIKKGKENCNRCKSEKAAIVSEAMTTAKNCIRGLRGPQLNQLKKLLNARQLRVIAKNGKGQTAQFTL